MFGYQVSGGIGNRQAAGYGTFMESLTTACVPAGRPRIRVLSLGAGPHSSALLLLACEHRIPLFNAAIFADPGWLHPAVHHRVEYLARIAEGAGIPLYRVSAGNIRDDALSPWRRFASMPLWYRGPDGRESSARRQCVTEYKTRPIKALIRELLGYPPPARVPGGVFAELAISLTAAEIGQARDPDVRYLHYAYPLIGLGWTTADCRRYLFSRGLTAGPLAMCLGCPHHGNRWWRYLHDHEPGRWDEVVTFDRAIRHGHPRASDRGQQLRGYYYLHMSRQPLDQVRLGPVRDLNGLPGYAEDGIRGGCSPWTRPVIRTPADPQGDPAGTYVAASIRRSWTRVIKLGRAAVRRLAAVPRRRTRGQRRYPLASGRRD
jgi:hypothetical protein